MADKFYLATIIVKTEGDDVKSLVEKPSYNAAEQALYQEVAYQMIYPGNDFVRCEILNHLGASLKNESWTRKEIPEPVEGEPVPAEPVPVEVPQKYYRMAMKTNTEEPVTPTLFEYETEDEALYAYYDAFAQDMLNPDFTLLVQRIEDTQGSQIKHEYKDLT